MRRILLASLLVVLSVTAAPRAQDAQTPSFRAGVEALPLDVTVVDDRGQPIRDLLAADFTVRVDGRVRRVASAQWTASAAEASTSAAPALPEGFVSNESSRGGRLIALVVDQPDIPLGEMRPIRDALHGFIDRLSASDRVAVVGLGQPSVSTPFTGDKTQLKQAVDRMPGQRQGPAGGSTHEVPVTAAMAIDRGDDAALEQVAARDCPGQTPRARQACKDDIRAEAMQIAEDAREQGDATLRGLREVLTSLTAIDGPKTLVFVSQGFFADRERGDDTGRVAELAGLASAARVHIYSLRLQESNDISVQKAAQPQLNTEDRLLRRYALETLTAAAGGTLFELTGTGGAVFDRLGAELSGYYLLGVEADPRDRDGKPHAIRVDVARKDVVVRTQRTMLATAPAADAASGRSPQQLVAAALTSPLPASSLPLRATAFAFRGLDPSKVRLLIHVEIGDGYTSPQRVPVAYYVVDKTGHSLDGEVTDVRLTPQTAGAPSPLVFAGGASVEPGDYTVKIAVADGERVGSLDLPVHAALLDLGRVRLTELIAGDAQPPVNLLRPTVGVHVRSGTVHGYLEAYGPDAATLAVTFEVAAEGRGPAILTADVKGALVGDERVLFSDTMLVQALPPGSYRLRAMVRRGDALLTTLGRAFEIADRAVERAGGAGASADPASAPDTPIFLPVDARELQRPFDRDGALAADVLGAFQPRVPEATRAAFDDGVAHLRKHEYRDAEATFKKAIQPDADSTAALVYLGVTYASAGRDTQAASVWRTALAGADDVPQLYAWLGDALMRLKSSGEARPILEEALMRFPSDARFARPLALLYATFGKGLDAVRLLERSLEARQDDQAALLLAVEWIFDAHRGGAVVHSRAEDVRLAHDYGARYLKTGGLNEPILKQWLAYLDKETP